MSERATTGRRGIRWKRTLGLTVAIVVGLALVVVAGAVNLVRGPVAWGRPDAPPGSAPDPVRLRADVERLAVELHPRSWRYTGNLEDAAAWIVTELAAAGFAVERQEYATERGTFTNVLGRREGTEPGASLVVVGAHYDSPGLSPGADDNASGVAALLELARTLPTAPGRRPLVLAAWCTEEPPFFWTEDMGSAAHVRSLQEAGTEVHLAVALDGLAYFDDTPGSQSLPLTEVRPLYPNRGDFLAVAGDLDSGPSIRTVKRGLRAQRLVPIVSFRAPEQIHGVMLSDHLSFRRAGMPAVMVTDTAFMRNPNHHETTDVPDTLDYDRLAAVVVGLRGVVREAGAAP